MSIGKEFGFIRDVNPTAPGRKKTKVPKEDEPIELDLDKLIEDDIVYSEDT